MDIITSRQNSLIKYLAKLHQTPAFRRSEGLCLAEGIHLVRDALACGLPIQKIILSTSARSNPEVLSLLSAAIDIDQVEVVDDCYAKISALKSPEGIAVLLSPKVVSAADLLVASARLGIMAGIQDPGNAGAIIRTAEAAGMTGVVAIGACADLQHPALLRASMGAAFRLPVLSMDESDFLSAATSSGLRLLIASGSSAIPFTEADYSTPFGLVIGSEGLGVPAALTAAAASCIAIPMAGQTESLNAAVAAGLLMYEAFRWNPIS